MKSRCANVTAELLLIYSDKSILWRTLPYIKDGSNPGSNLSIGCSTSRILKLRLFCTKEADHTEHLSLRSDQDQSEGTNE